MIILDFVSDWVEHLRHCLTAAGYELPPDVSPGKIPILYYSACQRGVAPRPRHVLLPRDFQCPPALRIRSGLVGFIECAERGGNLNQYQGRELALADEKDLLLFDWGIHHFHLGTGPCRADPRFVARTDDLLFARVTDDTIYLLEVARHGNWARKRLIEILHANWPETIARYRLDDILGTERELSDSDHLDLREAGITEFVHLADGTFYAPPGGGIQSSRDSTQAVLDSDSSMIYIKLLERQAAAEADGWLAQVRCAGLTPSDQPRIRLVVQESGFYARVDGTELTFPLDTPQDDSISFPGT